LVVVVPVSERGKKVPVKREKKETATSVPVSQILLDSENPRLDFEGVKRVTQEMILKKMVAEEGLEELASSFQKNGYFSEEPVILLRKGAQDGDEKNYIVLEGNRRLATLKLLLNPAKVNRLGYKGLFPVLSSAQASRLKKIPAFIYDSRDEVTTYLGVRHIAGAKRWGNFAKAKYIARQMESGRTPEELEETVGDSSGAIKKLARSWAIYRQAKMGIEDLNDKAIRENFSLVNEIVQNKALKNWLGVKSTFPRSVSDALVPEDNIDRLGHVLSWVFGSADGIGPVIHDSRDIRQKLGFIVEKEKALGVLIDTRDVDEALEYSDSDKENLIKFLNAAKKSVSSALPLVHASDSTVKELYVSLTERMNHLSALFKGVE
jgi:hypothetical protein